MLIIHDLDAVLLTAIALSAKRRPADLVSIMAATDLTPGALAAEFKLADAFHRLSIHGLICAQESGVVLTQVGQAVMGAQAKKAANSQLRIDRLKESLADYYTAESHESPIGITVEHLRSAIFAHRTAAKTPGKNLLLPKSAMAPVNDKRKGKWGKPSAFRRDKPRPE